MVVGNGFTAWGESKDSITVAAWAHYDNATKKVSGLSTFSMVHPNGRVINNIRSITYDKESGRATLHFKNGEKPLGSNIPIKERSACVDKSKC